MLGEVLYMTSVRVRASVDAAWNRFYDDWVTTFTKQVPGTRRGSRWRVTSGLVGGKEKLPPNGWPMYLALQEYRRLDEFALSRSWRREKHWEPRVRSFDPWFKDLEDYATLNLQKVDGARGQHGRLPPALLASIWTVDPAKMLEFEAWRSKEIESQAARLLKPLASYCYLAILAQLHRYGGPSGELVVPQRHHFEDGGRLCYVAIHELEALPPPKQQDSVLRALQEGLDGWSPAVADRQDTFAETLLAVER